MIEKINLKDIATFDENGIELVDLNKINFIYGVNGSGKTTITKFIYEPENSLFTNCSLRWKSDLNLRKLVYNKDFRDRNFGKGTIDGVFTLGQATKEESEKIDQKRIELSEIKTKGLQKKETIENQTKQRDKLEDDFREEVWQSVYKKYEFKFNKEAFKGVLQKKPFLARLLQEFDTNNADLKTFEELSEKSQTIFGKIPVKMESIMEIDFVRLNSIESDNIWSKKIIGKSDVEIAQLIQRLNINDWVNEGRKYIQVEDDICPFCQQPTIDSKFKKQIEDYFDETFLNDTRIVKELSDEYLRISENIINDLQLIENSEKAKENTKLDINKFSSRLKTIISQIAANKEIVSKKLKEPSRDFSFIDTSEVV